MSVHGDVALAVRGLAVCLDGRHGLRNVLRDVELSVSPGRVFALIGESGSGKTCLIQSVLGLHPGLPGVVAGEVEVLGRRVFPDPAKFVSINDGPTLRVSKDVIAWNKEVRRGWEGVLGGRVTLVSQDAATALSPFHDIGKLLTHAVCMGEPGLDRKVARERGREWLEKVRMYDISSVMGRHVPELSGGMAQRVAIAVALAPGPDLVIADEPTTGLDATLRIELIALMSAIVKERATTLLLVTHDMGAARLIADEVAVLYQGTVVETGPVDRVLDPAWVVKHPYTAYLLEAERRLLGALEMPRERWDATPGDGCPCVGFCAESSDRCREARPPLTVTDSPSHQLACWVRCL